MTIDAYLETVEKFAGQLSAADRERLDAAVQNIADVVNHASSPAVGAYIGHVLHRQHRHLQAEAVRAIGFALRQYGRAPQEWQDARNEYAVRVAATMAEPF
jgi:hypothetical protein